MTVTNGVSDSSAAPPTSGADQNQTPPSGTLLFFLAALGASLAALVIFFDHVVYWPHLGHWRPLRHEQYEILLRGPFLLWAVLISAQAALWFVAVPAIHRVIGGFQRRETWKALLGVVVLAALVFFGVLVGAFAPIHWRAYTYIDNRDWKIAVLGCAGAAVGLYATYGMFVAYEELKGEFERPSGSLQDRIERYLDRQERLHLLLFMVGAVLGLAILAVGAERNVIITFNDKILCHAGASRAAGSAAPKTSCPDSHFPREYMLAYGFYFTTLLALVYAPAYALLLNVGRKIRDEASPMRSLLIPDVADWKKKRDALDELLDLRVGTAADFRAGIAILAPLASSLVSLLLAKGK